MTLRYLSEHALNARLALDLAIKEVGHLQYSDNSLFAQQIDMNWVRAMANKPETAEKVETLSVA